MKLKNHPNHKEIVSFLRLTWQNMAGKKIYLDGKIVYKFKRADAIRVTNEKFNIEIKYKMGYNILSNYYFYDENYSPPETVKFEMDM